MSTKTGTAAADTPSEAAPHDLIDDHSGVYGWFRRHQKKLLYSVGLFVLVFFSVSGPMLAFVKDMFNAQRPLSTMMVGGQRVSLQPEDIDIGNHVAQRKDTMARAGVMPPISPGDGSRTDLGDMLAFLRRAAITEGIDVSMVEVDRAMATMIAAGSVESESQLARQLNFASLADCRQTFAEAMRIGTLVRLQSLALDNSEASILERIKTDREKITFHVATFDEKALDEQLKAVGGMSKEDLRAWLDAKDKGEQTRLGVFDTNQVALRMGALLFAEFDRSQWSESLDGFEIGDEERKRVYGFERERFKNEDGTYKPEDDETVVAELNMLLETEKVMQDILTKITEQRGEFVKEVNDERQRCNTEYFTTQNEVSVLEKKIADNPEDTAAVEELAQKKEVLIARENEKKAAEEAANQRLGEFDFPAAFAELTKDKAGIVQRAFTEKRKEAELKDLEANDIGLGEWGAARNATFHRQKGDMCFRAQRTTKAAMIYQVTDILVQPLKPDDELQPLLEGAYFTEKAKEQATAAKEKLEAALLRLAKAKIPEKVSELEGSRQQRIDDKVTEWETKMAADIAAAEQALAETRPETRARAEWEANLGTLQAMQAKKADRIVEFEKAVDVALEEEIAAEARKVHKDVLDEAAAEAGFTVTDVGPLPRDVQSRPRFDKRYDPTTVFLFRNHSELDEGEATGVVQDVTNRRWQAAFCAAVEPLTDSDVERREFEQVRKGYGFANSSYASLQAGMAYSQAYTLEAIKQRYQVESPAGTQVVDDLGGGGKDGNGTKEGSPPK
ncbi:MAG: hypothetical protein KDC98_02175 [Planctomycetes bacterium]|nr:hypothetical protein [Planctomycetota bacterium]